MRKREIIKNFKRMQGVQAKETFMREHNIKFTYDSDYNMIVWADDGVLQLFPIR